MAAPIQQVDRQHRGYEDEKRLKKVAPSVAKPANEARWRISSSRGTTA